MEIIYSPDATLTPTPHQRRRNLCFLQQTNLMWKLILTDYNALKYTYLTTCLYPKLCGITSYKKNAIEIAVNFL